MEAIKLPETLLGKNALIGDAPSYLLLYAVIIIVVACLLIIRYTIQAGREKY